MAATAGHPLARVVAIQAAFYALLSFAALWFTRFSPLFEDWDGEFLSDLFRTGIFVGWLLVPILIIGAYKWLWEWKGMVAYWRLVGVSAAVNFVIGASCWFAAIASALGAG